MNTVIGIQSRSGSTRLPAKALLPLLDKPIWKWTYDTCMNVRSTLMLIPDNDALMEESCKEHHADYIRGSEESPLDRYQKMIKIFHPKFFVRCTSDCPLLSRILLIDTIEKAEQINSAFLQLDVDGTDVQVCRVDAFEEKYQDKEHVFNVARLKKDGIYTVHTPHFSVDDLDDYKYINRIVRI